MALTDQSIPHSNPASSQRIKTFCHTINTAASLLTGRYGARFGCYGNRESQVGIPASVNLAHDDLKPFGYTSGIIGKWHLGNEPRCYPLGKEFDSFFGVTDAQYDCGNSWSFRPHDNSKPARKTPPSMRMAPQSRRKASTGPVTPSSSSTAATRSASPSKISARSQTRSDRNANTGGEGGAPSEP